MGMGLYYYSRLLQWMQPVVNEPVYITRAKKAAQDKLQEYFPKAARNPLFACATALDPRQKFAQFNLPNPIYDTSKCQDQVISTWEQEFKPNQSETHVPATSSIFDFVIPADLVTQDELNTYLNRPLLMKTHLSPAEEILAFWKAEEAISPNLAKMARKFLGVPIASVEPERLFSTARHAIPYTRSSLKPETIKVSLLLKQWFKIFQ